MRYETPAPPAELGELDGLAYSLWLPEADPWAGVVILHGAGSCKESHHDFARAARAARALGGLLRPARPRRRAAARSTAARSTTSRPMAALLGDVPLALRGSSMGGYLAIVAAEPARRAAAVVAICPASADGLRRGAAQRRARASAPTCPRSRRFLAEHPTRRGGRAPRACPLLLLHAEGDERVPVAHSRELARRSPDPRTELVVVPGGHHRSVQHDAELQGHSLRWLRA